MGWILFAVLGIVHIYTIYIDHFWLMFGSKALLMPIAAWSLAKTATLNRPYVRLVFMGLWFGWLGDVCLHFPSFATFITGLVAFLIGHIYYIRGFSDEVKQKRVIWLVMDKPYLILPYLAFFIYIIVLMNPHLDGLMKLPVFLYCFAILLMSLMALSRYYAVSNESWLLVWIGSLLFVASDFVLAFNKFVGEVAYARYIIMSTYISGQGLIAYGVAKMYAVKDG
jgi:uncharacterized membrane protein YhhN